MMSRRTLVLWAALAAGCGSGAASDAEERSDERAAHEALARQFGEHVLRGDWAAAYAMTTGQFRGAVPQSQMRADYENLLREIRSDDPAFQPNRVEADSGTLPSDEAEAKDTYGIRLVPPRASWRAWMSAGIGFGNDQGIERGIDAWLLIVDDLGQLKIAHVDFEFMD
jgi:hypothetical protein